MGDVAHNPLMERKMSAIPVFRLFLVIISIFSIYGCAGATFEAHSKANDLIDSAGYGYIHDVERVLAEKAPTSMRRRARG